MAKKKDLETLDKAPLEAPQAAPEPQQVLTPTVQPEGHSVFECPVAGCGSKYQREDVLRKHLMRVHAYNRDRAYPRKDRDGKPVEPIPID